MHAFLCGLEWALGRHNEMQGAAGHVEPAVAVVWLQGRRLDGGGLEALVEDQPVLGRVGQLFGHAVGVEQALLGQVAMLVGRLGPHRLAVEDGGKQRRILQAGEFVFVERGGAAHPHEAETAVGVTLVQRRLGAVANHLVVELQQALGLTKALEVVPDQQRHWMTDEHRYLTGRQERIWRVRLGPGDAIALQVGSGDDAVRLQLGTQHTEIVAFVEAVGLGGLE